MPVVSSEGLARRTLASLPEPHRWVLAVHAAVDGASLHVDHVAALTGLPDAGSIVESLDRRHLVESDGDRSRLVARLDQQQLEAMDVDGWAEKLLVHFAQWAEGLGDHPQRVVEEVDPLVEALRRTPPSACAPVVLRLVRAVERPVALSGKWGAWEFVLRAALDAARSVADAASEAWALHELGLRALLLGDHASARDHLRRALDLRESLGDEEGQAVTRYHLGLLGGGSPHPD